ncbi:MAG: trypsin-like peptidase domain-containing protein [Bacillota bacterium]|nr:trypsin-like peptidase domain-containing protein [Bacillota bacterium]
MKKWLIWVLLLAMLTGVLPIRAEQYTGYEAVLSPRNPVPGIVKSVRPGVVQVLGYRGEWSESTGVIYHKESSGSGVYVDEKGYIITNKHIVENADKVEVVLLDEEVLSAQVLGTDSGIDLAVLKVEPVPGLKPVPLGDSDALEIGELAIAIGNPGGQGGVLPGTVTVGIISALDREDVSAGNFTRSVKVIQTDAAINTGNSGGALLNARGEMIGMPTLKMMFDAMTVFEGMGFAVPTNTILPVYRQLLETGRVKRPRLGLTVLTLTGPEEPLRSHPPMGAKVISVEPGAPGSLADIRPGDIILRMDGERVTGSDKLVSMLDACSYGQKVTLDLCRYFDPLTDQPLDRWEMLTVEVTLSEE